MIPIPQFLTTPPSLTIHADDSLGAKARRTLMLALQAFGIAMFLWVRAAHRDLSPLLVLFMELTFVSVVTYRVARIANAARTSSTSRGVRGIVALRETLLTAFPGPVGHIMASEIAVWISLWRLATRWRREAIPTFTYHKGSIGIGMLVVMVLTAPVEILLFEVLIPWEPVRWFLLLASVYSIIWFAGFMLAPMAFPHTIGNHRLTLRNGALTLIDIPLANIATIERASLAWPPMTGRILPTLIVRDATAYLPGNERSQVRITLCHPQVIAPQPDDAPVTTIVFTADDPTALVTALS